MRQIEKKKGKDKVAAVLMLCFCLIALVSIFTIKSSIDKISKSAGDIPVTTETPTEPEKDAAEESEKESEAEAEEASGKIPTVDSKEQETQTTGFVSPMDMNTAKISKKYSMDMVIYNLTLDCNDMVFHVIINKQDLLGEPKTGRRFKGQVWMQGTVKFEA